MPGLPEKDRVNHWPEDATKDLAVTVCAVRTRGQGFIATTCQQGIQ